MGRTNIYFLFHRYCRHVSSIMHYELCIMNYELFYGVPAIAVGLSAISFSAALQKDAASIPNALGATDSKSQTPNNKS